MAYTWLIMVNSLWRCIFSLHERLVLDNVSCMHQIECSLQYILNCSPFPWSPFPLSLPPFRCPDFYHCLLGGTVGYHRDCIRSCYSCVILADIQAETEGYARPYGWHRNECFNMQLTSAGSPFLLQSPNKGAPPTPPLPLLFPPKALTASSSNQIPATVQWRGPISDNAIAACLSGCMYVR